MSGAVRSLATAAQIRAIKTAQRRQGLDDGAYRAALEGFGAASSKALTVVQANAFLDRLNGAVGRPASRRATGPFAKKLQALWIAAWNLGAVRDPDDTALLTLVERQTGIPHTRFLRDATDAEKAIEAVKAMLVRAGVRWPSRPGPGAIELKRAIVAALYARLAEHGLYPEFGPFDRLDGPALDALARRLGAVLRPALDASRTVS